MSVLQSSSSSVLFSSIIVPSLYSTMMECEYSKFGCTTKCANSDHQQLHLHSLAHQHLKLVAVAFEKEVEKNHSLSTSLETINARLEQAEKRLNELSIEKFKDLESKLLALQGKYLPISQYITISIMNVHQSYEVILTEYIPMSFRSEIYR